MLVVDDEPLIRWSICTALATAGLDAVGAATPADARRLAGEWPPPRAILLDVNPDGAGREIIRDILTLCPACVFIVMTTAPRERIPWLEDEDVEVVEKPFDIGSLVARVVAVTRDDDGRHAA